MSSRRSRRISENENTDRLIAFVVPVSSAESKEMNYQYYNDYDFDFSKFEKRFGKMSTPPGEVAKALVAEARARKKAGTL